MKSFVTIFTVLMIALMVAIVVGVHEQNKEDRVCGDTHNRALCVLGLMAGKSDVDAHNDGNV